MTIKEGTLKVIETILGVSEPAVALMKDEATQKIKVPVILLNVALRGIRETLLSLDDKKLSSGNKFMQWFNHLKNGLSTADSLIREVAIIAEEEKFGKNTTNHITRFASIASRITQVTDDLDQIVKRNVGLFGSVRNEVGQGSTVLKAPPCNVSVLTVTEEKTRTSPVLIYGIAAVVGVVATAAFTKNSRKTT